MMIHHWKGILLLGIMGLSLFIGEKAYAERVISDYEASKLTLAALTAPPTVARHRSRIRRHHGASPSVKLALKKRHHAASVRTVAYRHARHPAAVVHRRKRHHRT